MNEQKSQKEYDLIYRKIAKEARLDWNERQIIVEPDTWLQTPCWRIHSMIDRLIISIRNNTLHLVFSKTEEKIPLADPNLFEKTQKFLDSVIIGG